MEKAKIGSKKLKLKLQRNNKIIEDKTEVGYINIEVEKNNNKNDVIEYFKADTEVVNSIKKLRLPKKFTFVWIDKIFIRKCKRDRGFGSKILKMLEKRFKNHTLVLGLSPGKLVKTTDVDKLLPFYTNNGFKIISTDGHYYGFKVVKKL